MNSDNSNSNKNLSDKSQESPLAKTACGGLLDHPENFHSAMYGSERIYFCTQASLRIFEQHPDDFMAGKIEHPLEAE